MQYLVECNGLNKTYEEKITAVDNLTLKIPHNVGMVGLLGPNGSGKTTLIKLLTGLLSPTKGELYIAGYPVGVETKSIVSYLPDAHSLNDSYTVQQQIDYCVDFFDDFDKDKAEKMLIELAINKKQKIKTLSKGTKEKVALILTLSRNARLFILDEPIAGVDPAAREYILQTILKHKSKNSTVLLSTHLISEIEEYFDYVLFLKQGKIVLEGKTDDVRKQEGKTIDELFREVFRWV